MASAQEQAYFLSVQEKIRRAQLDLHDLQTRLKTEALSDLVGRFCMYLDNIEKEIRPRVPEKSPAQDKEVFCKVLPFQTTISKEA